MKQEKINSPDFLSILEKRREEIYSDSKSVMKELDTYLLGEGIYRSFDNESFLKEISKKNNLTLAILNIFEKTYYINEKIFILEILYSIGCDEDLLVEKILNEIYGNSNGKQIWTLCDLLYRIHNLKFLNEYINIAKNKSFGTSRKRILDLIKSSHDKNAIKVLNEISFDI